MRPYGSLTGDAVVPTRRFLVEDSVSQWQVLCQGTVAAGDPASVNDYTEAIGVTFEGLTVSTVQGSGGFDNLVRASFLPNQVYKGKCSGGATADTDFSETTDGNLLTNTSASAGGTVCTDGDVGTSEFVGGLLVGLAGGNAGAWRPITAHSDNTSTTVTDPFNNAIAVGDTFIRTFGPQSQGLELTSNYIQFNMTPGAGVDLPDTGHAVAIDIFVDGFKLVNPDHAEILTPTQPVVEVSFVFVDHYANSVA